MEKSDSIKEIAAALSKAQGSFLPVKQTAKVDYITKGGQWKHYGYAPLSTVLDACRKALADNGLAILQPTGMIGAHVNVETILIHSSGEWVSSNIIIESQSNDPQSIGSVLSYARRYALSALLGIASEEDDDAEAAQGDSGTSDEKEWSKMVPASATPAPIALGDHWCEKHQIKFFKTERMRAFSHPVNNEDGSPMMDVNGKQVWCSEPTEKSIPIKPTAAISNMPPPATMPSTGSDAKTESQAPQTPYLDPNWLKDALTILAQKQPKNWSEKNVLSYLKAYYKVEGATPLEAAAKLDQGAAAHFRKAIEAALKMA